MRESTASTTNRHVVETRHGYLHVRTAGAASGTPLVLLHMTPQSGKQFARIAPLLADRPLVMPDRIGFGESDDLAGPLPMEEVALATLDALDRLGVERFDVVGIHTGSTEAIELATAYPDRVRRVGVVAIPAFDEEDRAAFRAAGGPPELQPDGSHLLRAWQSARNPKQPPLDGVRWTVADVHRQALSNLRAGPAMWWMLDAVRAHRTGELACEVRQPFLVLAPHDDVQERTERVLPHLPPNARIVELPHMDFEVFALNADELAGHIRSFLDAPDEELAGSLARFSAQTPSRSR